MFHLPEEVPFNERLTINWLNEHGITNYKIDRMYPENGKPCYCVDVDGDVNLSDKGLQSIDVVFRTVAGDFDLSENDQLESLKNAPLTVKGYFSVAGACALKSLEGAPQLVEGNCYLNRTSFTSLHGAPQTVNGHLNLSETDITSFEGMPAHVGGNIKATKTRVKSLIGLPAEVNNLTISGHFYQTLEGAPKVVHGSLDLHESHSLRSLKGGPQRVAHLFDVSECKNLTSLEYAPQHIGGDFHAYRSAIKELNCPETEILGAFIIANNPLSSLKNAPRYVGKEFDADRCKLANIEDLTSIIDGDLYLTNNPLESAYCPHAHIKEYIFFYDENDCSTLDFDLKAQFFRGDVTQSDILAFYDDNAPDQYDSPQG